MTVPMFEVGQSISTSDDYWTPEWLFEDMGISFDLDVAAPPGGVPWIPAADHYSQADDGLGREWSGRVWMNPPFSETEPWAVKFAEHGNGVALLPFSRAQWWIDLWSAVDAIAVVPVPMLFVVGDFRHPGRSQKDRGVFMPTGLYAFGVECVEAIGRVGHVR